MSLSLDQSSARKGAGSAQVLPIPVMHDWPNHGRALADHEYQRLG